MTRRQRLVVCVLAVREDPDGRRLLLQRRHKKNDDTPYVNYLELPQGKVESGESLIDAARRELREETGLAVESVIYGKEEPIDGGPYSDLNASHPLVCVADRSQNHFGVAVMLTVSGALQVTQEADEQKWYSNGDIKIALARNIIFPLNRPMLDEYLKWAISMQPKPNLAKSEP